MGAEQGKKNLNRKKQAAVILLIAVFLVVSAVLLVPAIPYLAQPEEFRAYMDARGRAGIPIYMGMVILQVISAVIPAGPFEFAAGFLFGVVRGTLLCDAAMLIGSSIAFFLSRHFGMRIAVLFGGGREIAQLQKLFQSGKRQVLYVFLFTVIPALPKDFLPYFLGMTRMKFPVFALIMFFGRIPGIVMTALFADAVLYQNKGMIVLMILAAGVLYAGTFFLLHQYQAGKPPFGKRKRDMGKKS